jgi:hypothetical protein
MKVDNVKHLTTNSAVSPTKQVIQNQPTNNTTNVGQTRQPDTMQIMHQHAQVSRHQSSNVGMNPNNILNMFKSRRLGDRSLSGVGGGHEDVPAMHPDTLEEVFGLLNGIKTAKSTINIQTKKLLKRFGQVKNIIDSNYEPEDEEDKKDLKNVKRKTTSTVKKEDVRDVIEEMIGKDPTNAYIIIENTKHELGLIGANPKDPKNYTQLDKAIIEFSKDNYSAHGIKIRADVNIANEANKSGKTQFREWYYGITQDPSLGKLNEIRKVCVNHTEFMAVTNLMAQAAVNDRDGEKRGRLPTSDQNTIHDVISVMNKRSVLNSLHHAIIRLKKTFASFIDILNGGDKEQSTTGGSLIQHSIPQQIKSKT